MIIGVPKEIKEQEQRVALLPSAAGQLVRREHSVLVEAPRTVRDLLLPWITEHDRVRRFSPLSRRA